MFYSLLQFLSLLLILSLLYRAQISSSAAVLPPPAKESPEFWVNSAKQDLARAKDLYKRVYTNTAKNAIMFIGDGMGMTTITSGRIYKGQLKANTAGEESLLNFERLPHTALVKTYNTDWQTPDSAGTATAYLCGVKARSATLGVNQYVDTKNCSTYDRQRHNVNSFLDEALTAGKSVGIVTTTRVTHATPAAAYSHSVHRDWEDDTERNSHVPANERSNCPDIAQQLINNAKGYSVVFGGGRRKFLPTSNGGSRSDNVNLIDAWKQQQRESGRSHAYVETREQLMQLSTESTDAVLGLFSASHLDYDLANGKKPDNQRQPTLTEMTTKALDILKRNPKGFALLVEGGRIDHGHHDNSAKNALHDLVALDSAIGAALEMTDESDTLIVVTADHSHVFSIGGWARRGNPILGKVRYSYEGNYNKDGEAVAEDNMPYTSLYYGDGPSAPKNAPRRNLTGVNTQDDNYLQSAIVPLGYESHGSEDVPVYARGPGAHLLHTTHEQSYLGNLFKHAICVGEYKESGNCLKEESSHATTTAAATAAVVVVTALAASVPAFTGFW